ncbi:MAG: hydrogenase expression/formation protein HypE [Dehalococcoidales bacterium]|nr:hydrogenase expression/formation protein HypE [Dehalococcoidales bacterium]
MAEDRVLLGHGSGGRLSHDLIQKVFTARFDSAALRQQDDSAVLDLPGGRLAFTTDSYVVKPLFFQGGDIGRLAVCGTVNDLAMVGALAQAVSTGFIIEEGFPVSDLERVVASMREAADEAGVEVVTGDTKVVERGGVDGLFVNTAGIGQVVSGAAVSGRNARPGDKIIVSGTIGDHGIAVVSAREGLSFTTNVVSDVAPLNHLVQVMLEVGQVHALRDPTRGGLATTLNEIAAQSGVGMALTESALPVRNGVRAACEMLGFDPLYVANEGKLVAVVAPEVAEQIVDRMRATRYGEQAVVIGEVTSGPAGRVLMRTTIGGTRVVDMLAGELLPRIC